MRKTFTLGSEIPDNDLPKSGRKHVQSTVHYTNRVIVKPSEVKTHTIKTKEKQGREAWSALHEYTGCNPGFVREWEAMIPSYGCSCRKDYEELKKQYPFDYSSPDRFFISAVELHNAVNRKLGKPEVTIGEARRIWNRPAT